MVPSRASAFWHINGAPWSLSLVAPEGRCETQGNQLRRSRSYGVRMAAQLLPGLERKLKAEITGDVMFDRFSRGRYATDASHYQMMPLGVVAPRTIPEANGFWARRARRGSACCRAAAAPLSRGRPSTSRW